ncbi:DUF2285 domain-containing protein [Paracoccus methylovorus]|uniref:DUF2285 domain-containing protein n=1 Tax=Paracoccus methylovorus TaxID=2812658 RepID=A0ABX7JN92_9RHOB|nr:DUF2285 domain-containing protein [Paracoccus methylovorus]QRZ15743.1 DUF2285 domain-containing protein [Paracoccus methylovorus]
MAADAFEEIPPQSERLTGYDEAHLTTYLRLLDAEEEGADWREVARIVFGLDVDADPGRAKRIHDSHLARARWMTEAGYRQLLKPHMR